MTGIALGVNDIPKIALGTTEIETVSLGTVVVWPNVPPGAGFVPMTNAWVRSQSGSANSITARIDFVPDGTTLPGAAGGTMSTSGILNWWVTPPPPTPAVLWIRVRLISQNGGALNVFGMDLNAIPLDTWVDFNAISGFQCNLNSTGSNSYNRSANLAVDFSTTPGGGVVASTSTFALNVIKT